MDLTDEETGHRQGSDTEANATQPCWVQQNKLANYAKTNKQAKQFESMQVFSLQEHKERSLLDSWESLLQSLPLSFRPGFHTLSAWPFPWVLHLPSLLHRRLPPFLHSPCPHPIHPSLFSPGNSSVPFLMKIHQAFGLYPTLLSVPKPQTNGSQAVFSHQACFMFGQDNFKNNSRQQ